MKVISTLILFPSDLLVDEKYKDFLGWFNSHEQLVQVKNIKNF
jgi:hypothetical protein